MTNHFNISKMLPLHLSSHSMMLFRRPGDPEEQKVLIVSQWSTFTCPTAVTPHDSSSKECFLEYHSGHVQSCRRTPGSAKYLAYCVYGFSGDRLRSCSSGVTAICVPSSVCEICDECFYKCESLRLVLFVRFVMSAFTSVKVCAL